MTFGEWLRFISRLDWFGDDEFSLRSIMWLWDFGASLETAGRALLLSEGLYQGPADFNEPFTFPFALRYGITGVGLYAKSQTDIVPCVYTQGNSEITELTAEPFPSDGPFYEAIVQVFGNDLAWILRDLVLVQTGPVQLQYDPGDKIQTSGTGQLGAPVRWGTSRGFLTAGHVGKSVGTVVYDAHSNVVGSVVFALDPTGQVATPAIDVAVIEVASGTPWGNSLGITGTTSVPPTGLSAIDVYQRSSPNPVSTHVRSNAKWWIVSAPGYPATKLRGVYLSTTGVTSRGDSGGPVLLQGTTEIVGHVVAGGPATSFIQDVRHQLRKIKSDPVFNSIRI
jgi:hypothetical protein